MCRERNDPIASRVEVCVGCHEQRTDLLLEEKSEGSVQSRVVAGFCYEKTTTDCPRSLLKLWQLTCCGF
ncbi:MAG: hypothetical protein WCB62_04580 [Pseudolabrys sp.]